MSVARVRLADVAREAGVSIATASAVLIPRPGNNTRVGAATAARVSEVAARLHFQPNQTARQLAGKRSGILGVIVDSMAPEAHFRILAQLEKALVERGYRMLVGQSHDRPEALVDYIRDLASRGIDGLFCLAHDYPQQLHPPGTMDVISEAVSRIEHVLFLGRPRHLGDHLRYVFSDAAYGVAEAYGHLRARGCQRIGLVLHDRWYQTHQDRIRGFVTSSHDAGENDPEYWMMTRCVEPGSAVVGEVWIQKVIETLVVERRADALIATNDLMAIQLIKRLKRIGVRVPDDVAVMGYDNLQMGELYEPSVTSVDQNAPEICRQAVAAMDQMIQGQAHGVKLQIQVRPFLVKRDSA